jgi:hypothetical protein
MSPTLDIVDAQSWRPLGRHQFRQLRRGQRLQDRGGQVWTVRAEPYEEDGAYRVVLLSGALVRLEYERFADTYTLVEESV